LVVRLRNWVGDVVLSVPTLRRLESAGHDLHLVGKGWASGLLEGFGWKVHRVADTYLGRIRQLRELRLSLGGETSSLVFPYSFSSAFEARAAGLSPIGFAGEGRSWLLRQAVPMPLGLHTLDEYWALGQAYLGTSEPAPDRVEWVSSRQAEAEGDRLLREHGLAEGYALICPFSGGTVDGERKRWPHFPELAAALAREGVRLVACPGSEAEMRTSRRLYPDVLALPGVGMGAYGVLLRRARLVVSNDTGPGHLAAAVGGRLLSVLGPTPLGQWRPRGSGVTLEHSWPEWPSTERVLARSRSLLSS
jgi:heptosyltransferase-2